jgi:hypothetical protein
MIHPLTPELEELRKFHIDRRSATQIAATCEKSPVPMVWLDSSILIDFAKIAADEPIDKLRAKNLSRLPGIIRAGVRAQRLICPEWDQSLEFEGKRLERQIRRIVSDLACDAHCVTYTALHDGGCGC